LIPDISPSRRTLRKSLSRCALFCKNCQTTRPNDESRHCSRGWLPRLRTYRSHWETPEAL
jgi:hypothetical protein